MKNSKIGKFICKISICITVVIIIIIALYQIPYYPNRYLNAYKAKIELLNQDSSNRIILVGGSNVGFGFDSKMLHDSLDRDVVNMGLHAGLGLKFMLDEILDYAKAGDVIIISPEYYLLCENIECSSPELLEVTLDVDNTKNLSIVQKIKLIWYIPPYLGSRLNDWFHLNLKYESFMAAQSSSLYTADAINDYGDIVKHWSLLDTTNNSIASLKSGINRSAIKHLNARIDYLRSIGCSVHLLPCTFNKSSYDINRHKIALIEKALNDVGLKYIMNPQTQAFSDSWYYDTYYHLKKEGAQQRSLILIQYIKENHSQCK